MNETGRSRSVELLILASVALAFIDESVRKALPETPVLVTALKDMLIFAAGFQILMHLRAVPGRYSKYFLLWVLVTLASSLWVLGRFYSLMALGATIRTYSLCPLLFAAGYYLGCHEEARRRVARLFLIGGIAAIAIAVAQEYSRDSLPALLSTRIYKARHGGAGGEYNESLFASPQTLAEVAVVLGAWSFAALTLPSFSRRHLSALALLLASLATVYLSRIRVALLVLLFVALLIWLGVWRMGTRRDQMPAPLRGLIVGLLVLSLAAVFYLTVYRDLSESSGEEVARDIGFFEEAFDIENIKYRSGVFLREFARPGEHDWFFGHGAGTGGQSREFLDIEGYDIPTVSDTGLYLLYHEMGMLGLVCFLICYGGLLARCAFRLVGQRTIPPETIPAFSVGAAFLLWFLLKSHTVIANGLSHILWMGSIGICCGAIDRGTAATGDDLIEPPAAETAPKGRAGSPSRPDPR